MARIRGSRRRRRGRFSALLKLLSFAVIVGAIAAALTLFFRMDHIIITGNTRYTEQQVLEASGLHEGENLYAMNKFTVKERIFDALPYVKELAINRRLPDTLLIELRECSAAAGVQEGQTVWLISTDGKILEQTSAVPAGAPRVVGGELAEPEVGGQLHLAEEQEYRTEVLLALLDTAEARGMRRNIGEIDLSDATALVFTYLDRFTVKMPWTSDIVYKLRSLEMAVEALEINQTGVINLMTEGKTSFIPY